MNRNPQNGSKSLSIEKPVLSVNVKYQHMLYVGVKMKKSFLILIVLNSVIVTLFSQTLENLNIKKTPMSNQKVKFVEIINKEDYNHYKSVAENEFDFLSNKEFIWNDIENKYATFLGKIKRNNEIFWLYKMDDGQLITSVYDDFWDKDKVCDYSSNNFYVFVIVMDSLNDNYINNFVWLNKTEDFQFESLRSFIPISDDWFERFEKVKIIGVKSIYNGGTGNLWFVVQNDSGNKALLKYDVDYYRNDLNDFYYYLDDPLNNNWGKDIVKCIKEKKVKIGMTKYQVMVSWGKPDDINRSVGSWGTHEQWIYKRGNFKSQYLYFENGKLTSLQD